MLSDFLIQCIGKWSFYTSKRLVHGIISVFRCVADAVGGFTLFFTVHNQCSNGGANNKGCNKHAFHIVFCQKKRNLRTNAYLEIEIISSSRSMFSRAAASYAL